MKYVLTAVGVFFLDFFLKNQVEASVMQEGDEKQICHGMLLLRKHHNKGAFLNMGEKKRGFVAVLSIALTLAVTVLFLMTFTIKGNGILKTGLSLLMGGAYSNTYDRLRRKYVVDYVSFPVKQKALRRIIFNISDFCIMIGAMFIVIGSL